MAQFTWQLIGKIYIVLWGHWFQRDRYFWDLWGAQFAKFGQFGKFHLSFWNDLGEFASRWLWNSRKVHSGINLLCSNGPSHSCLQSESDHKYRSVFNKYGRQFVEVLAVKTHMHISIVVSTFEKRCPNHHHRLIHFPYKKWYFLQLIKRNNHYTSLIPDMQPVNAPPPSSIGRETLSAFFSNI